MKVKKNNKENLLSAGIFYLIGNVVGQAVVLLSSGIFTRIMDQSSNGLVNTYSAWVLVLNTFIGLNLFITVRNAYLDYNGDYDNFKSSVLLLSLLSSLCWIILTILVVEIFRLGVDLYAIVMAEIQAISLHTINFALATTSMENKVKLRTFLIAAPNIFHIVLSIGLVLIMQDSPYYAKITGNAAGLLVFAVAIAVNIFYKSRPKIDLAYWKYALKIGVPAIACTLADLILLESDRIMITWLKGEEETAVYSLVYNIGSILIAIYTALNGAFTPWFYKKLYSNEESRIKQVERKYIWLMLFLSIGLLTVSPEIVKLLSPQEYWYGIEYTYLIIIASIIMFIYSFFTTFMMYLKKPGIIAINTGIVAVVNLILNYFMIPIYGGNGAALATIISYTILFILHLIAAVRKNKNVFCIKEMIIALSGITIYSGIFFFIRENIVARYLIVLAMLVLAGILFVRFKKGRIKI